MPEVYRKLEDSSVLIDSMRKEADHIDDNIQIEKGCLFCKSPKEEISLIEKQEGFGTLPASYCHCTVCGIQTPEFSAVVSRKNANKKAIHFWNSSVDAPKVPSWEEVNKNTPCNFDSCAKGKSVTACTECFHETTLKLMGVSDDNRIH